ncbi:MAG TPA: ADOP family duplicated permease [Gemmatimonadaceae bacterium]|jgi:predicted permease
MIDRLRSDLRIALRSLARSPGIAITTTAILAVGIGMAIAMSTIVRTVMVQRLPVENQQQLVVLHAFVGNNELSLSTEDRKALRRETRTLRDVAGVGILQIASPNIVGGATYSLRSVPASGNFFEVLGARPALGRLLDSTDDASGLRHAVVLSYRAWREKFNGDSSVLGKRVGDPWDPDYHAGEYVIVGVAPPGLDFPAGVDNWYTYEGDPRTAGSDNLTGITVGRLAPGATAGAARAEWLPFRERAYAQTLARLHSSAQLHVTRVEVAGLADEILGNSSTILEILAAAVVLLFLIVCLNVGNLLLLRAASRSHELAVRRAVGASFGDILSVLLAEGVVIAIAGGVAGFLVAEALLHGLVAAAPAQLPRLDDISLAGAPVLTAALISLLATLLFGVAPGVAVARGSLASPLRIDTRAGGRTRQRRRLQQTLIAAQTALAVITLASAGLLLHSLERLERLDLGFNPDHLSVFSVTYPLATYETRAKVGALGREVLPLLRATPGVTALSTVELRPFMGADYGVFGLIREGAPATGAPTLVASDLGDQELFRTLGIPVIRGRAFLASDDEHAALVAVVSRAVAEQMWPGENPIGKRVGMVIGGNVTWRTVVGEVGDAHMRALRVATPTLYLPWQQLSLGWTATVAVRTSADFASVLPSLRRVLAQVDPQLTIWDAHSFDDLLGTELATPRLSSFLLGAFALVALLLAAIGLYGVMAFTVREETREIGLRMALGAGPERVRRDVLGRALSVIAIGGAIGLLGALASSRVLAGQLFQVQPADPVSLGAACLLLGVVALAAAYLPARRATRVDPAIALRAE